MYYVTRTGETLIAISLFILKKTRANFVNNFISCIYDWHACILFITDGELEHIFLTKMHIRKVICGKCMESIIFSKKLHAVYNATQ